MHQLEIQDGAVLQTGIKRFAHFTSQPCEPVLIDFVSVMDEPFGERGENHDATIPALGDLIDAHGIHGRPGAGQFGFAAGHVQTVQAMSPRVGVMIVRR